MMYLLNLLGILLSLMFMDGKEPTNEVCLNAKEAQLYQMINEYRASKKLPPIPISAALSKVAQVHVADLNENYNFSERCNPHSWSNKGDWSSCCYTSDHKKAQCMWDKPREIAGYESEGYEIAFWHSAEATPEASLAGWKKSEGHNPLLINTKIWKKITWNAIGIGVEGNYAAVWFGTKSDPIKPGDCN